MRKSLAFCALALFMLLAACARNYPGLPDLPAKDWLSPDKPWQPPKSEKYEIYSPDKTMTFNDLVWLAVQQSPVISRGLINLEIQEINKRDVRWRYLPEMHLSYHITTNMTKYNEGTRYQTRNYGETTYELTFTGHYNNPVSTFLSGIAADELMQTAIITQRKLIGDVIFNIAQTMLQIWLLEKDLVLIEEQIVEAEKARDFEAVRSEHETRLTRPDLLAEDNLKGLELELREKKAELTLARSSLKNFVGLETKQALKIDAASVLPILEAFDPQNVDWKNGWRQTEDRYLARQQIKLENANVYLAWASYLPNFGLHVNESPGKGQSQHADAQADQFLHVLFNIPLLDWGHRWRLADQAAARKRQRRLDEIQAERDYGEEWQRKDQNLVLADARLERAKQSLTSAVHRLDSVEVAWNNGAAGADMLSDAKRNVLKGKMGVVGAEYELYLQKLVFFHFMSGLAQHFLGDAGYQKDGK